MLTRAQIDYSQLIKPVSSVGDGKGAFVIAGPHGTGKSTFCASMAKKYKTLLIATASREVDSWGYQSIKIPHVLIEDRDWRPSSEPPSFIATGFSEFLRLLDWLREVDEEYEAVIVDSGTELAELGWHAAMMPHGVASPSDIEGRSRWLPYETLDILLDQAVKGVVSLSKIAKKPKWVGITWHVQPPKDDQETGTGTDKATKKSADRAAEGVEYEGKVLPMVRGRFRRRLGQLVPTFIYTDMQIKVVTSGIGVKQDVQYKIQVRPDVERHSKIPGPLPAVSYINNDFDEFLALLAGQTVAAKSEPSSASAASKLSRK